MKKLLLILLCLPMIGFGQVYIPDANFKAYLVGDPLINTNGDSEIQVSEATAFNGTINCSSMNIADLTGIEDFTALTDLICASNDLTSLDVSQNTALIWLDCSYNQLTTLDVSQNTALTWLACPYNQLTTLDVSGATALFALNCEYNQLTTLDVSNNTAFTYLGCQFNQLECLDISNNTALTTLYCQDNLLEQLNTKNGNWQNMQIDALNNNLTCVEVNNLGYANTNWIGSFDGFVTFSTDCNYANPCVTVSAIQEHTTNKELLKVTDILGRETKGTKNEVLFYIYDDGTVEKRIVIE